MADIDRSEPRTHQPNRFIVRKQYMCKLIVVQGGPRIPSGFYAYHVLPVIGDELEVTQPHTKGSFVYEVLQVRAGRGRIEQDSVWDIMLKFKEHEV